LGGTGIAWIIGWHLWYREDGLPVAGEPRHVHSHDRIPWGFILTSRQVWLIFAMYGCYSWGSWFFMGWFPTYLVRGAGFTESEMGIFSSLPFLLGIGGNLMGGLVSDRLVKKYGLKTGRIAVACTSLVTASLLIFALALTKEKRAVVVLSSVGFGVMDLMLPVSWAVCLDIGREYSGVITGIMNSAGQLGGFLCTVLVGYILHVTGNYTVPLWIISGMVMISAGLFSRIDPTRPLTPHVPHRRQAVPC
jgi:nitrate/nitrite transporter NarK